MRLLVVEDDDLLGAAVHKGLMRSGYAVDWARTGADATVAVGTHKYDGVLLDLGLPDTSGEILLKTIRQRHPGISIVVMTARGAIHDRISLLDIGADDYMVKPVDLDEVSARLRAVARRIAEARPSDSELEHGALRLLPSRHIALWHGAEVRLTRKEFWLLETFLRNKHKVLSRAQLEDTLYGWGEEIGSNTVEVYIHFLRRKFSPSLIHTERGVGYQLGSPAVFDA
jgi:DNA-binding response OmpR family regulator